MRNAKTYFRVDLDLFRMSNAALVGSPNLITARLDLVHNALYAVCLCGYAHVSEYIPNVIGQAHHSIYKKLCMHSKITFNKSRFTVCTENTDYRPTDYRQFRLSATPIIGNSNYRQFRLSAAISRPPPDACIFKLYNIRWLL